MLIEKRIASSTTDINVQSPNSIFSEKSSAAWSQTATQGGRLLDIDSPRFTSANTDNSPNDPSLPSGSWKGKGKEVSRGRSPERKARSQNPFERAESRPRRNDAAIEIEARSMGKRAVSRSSTFYEHPEAIEAVLEDHILEPCPHIPVCDNVSEVFDISSLAGTIGSGSIFRKPTESSLISFLSLNTASRSPSDSSAWTPPMTASLFPAPGLHPERASRTWSKDVDIEQLLKWSHSASQTESDIGTSLPSAASVKPDSLASTLPAEILQQIFFHLSPSDFNSARHSCQTWFIHSLSKPLLETSLQRMGYSDAICKDYSSNKASDEDITKYEWRLSKRIARECALGPNWSGNGIMNNANSKSTVKSVFQQVSHVDFTEAATYHPRANSTETIYTVSNCGKFLMAASGMAVNVYELNRSARKDETYESLKPGSMRPVTRIICPNRILACSMDTSSQRHAIAMLLEGRMGVVCEITALGNEASSPSSWDEYGEGSVLDTKTPKRNSESEKGRPCQGTPYKYFGLGNTSPPVGGNASAWQELFRDESPERSNSAFHSARLEGLPRLRIDSQVGSSSNQDPQNILPMPLEEGTRSLYRNLCSEDDPPKSVAICPQRRCVAFGCSSGIELHWVDALTGQNLNRWFPLTAPSDFLFFLPPRQNVDSAKKLRLISSTAKPSERPVVAEGRTRAESRNRPYWEEIGQEMRRTNQAERFESGNYRMNPRTSGAQRRRYTAGRNDTSDHYRAVPLSDGYHILFTDPTTGLLCLGSDAPLGGPTKLLRKIWFQSPEGLGTPIVYAGGSDLSAGIRVVAAFGTGDRQSIWLYSVPGDIFSTSQNEPSILVGPMMQPGSSKNDTNTDWMAWWPEDGLQEWLKNAQNPSTGVLPRSVWPVKIKGQEIGTCSSVSDLTIHSGPHMVIWAFGKDGSTTSWTIKNGRDEKLRNYTVGRDGSVKEIVEVKGRNDSVLSGEPEIFCMSPDSLDGASSPRSEVHRAKRRRVMMPTPPPDDVWQVDADGDVVMVDIDDMRNCMNRRYVEEEYLEESVVDGNLIIRKMVRRYDEERGIGQKRRVCVRVEELTGITRLDLEIR